MESLKKIASIVLKKQSKQVCGYKDRHELSIEEMMNTAAGYNAPAYDPFMKESVVDNFDMLRK